MRNAFDSPYTAKPEVPRSVKPEMRKLLPLGVLMSKPPLVMMVEPWPAPRMVMPFEVDIPLPQEQLPAGMRTVSPSAALVIAVATSARAHVAAETVAAMTGAANGSSISASAADRI